MNDGGWLAIGDIYQRFKNENKITYKISILMFFVNFFGWNKIEFFTKIILIKLLH